MSPSDAQNDFVGVRKPSVKRLVTGRCGGRTHFSAVSRQERYHPRTRQSAVDDPSLPFGILLSFMFFLGSLAWEGL